MKQFLQFQLLLLLGISTYGQSNPQADKPLPIYNLYYLSKYISSENLTPAQVDQVYNILINSIGTEKAKEITENYRKISKDLPVNNRLGAFLDIRELKLQDLQMRVIAEFSAGNFERIGKNEQIRWEANFKRTSSSTDSIKILNKLKILTDLKKYIEANDTIKVKEINMQLLESKSTDSILTTNKVDSVIKHHKKTIEEIKKYFDEVKIFAKKFIQTQDLSNYESKFLSSNDSKYATTEIQIVSFVVG